MMTPTMTAIAKSVKTVTAETVTKTRASSFGIRFIILKLLHSKVPITTINMTPTNAAKGILSINPDAKRIKHNNAIAAIIPDSLPLPPELILIML